MNWPWVTGIAIEILSIGGGIGIFFKYTDFAILDSIFVGGLVGMLAGGILGVIGYKIHRTIQKKMYPEQQMHSIEAQVNEAPVQVLALAPLPASQIIPQALPVWVVSIENDGIPIGEVVPPALVHAYIEAHKRNIEDSIPEPNFMPSPSN